MSTEHDRALLRGLAEDMKRTGRTIAGGALTRILDRELALEAECLCCDAFHTLVDAPPGTQDDLHTIEAHARKLAGCA